MRSILSGKPTAILGASLLIVAALFLQPTFAQDSGTAPDLQRTQQLDPINFQGRAEFKISDPDQVPAQLARAAVEAGCNYKGGIKQIPLQFVNIEGRRFVLVYCPGIVGTHQVFDLSNLRRPRPIAFPFLAQDAGIGTTPRPGLITWTKDAGVFEALTGTDICSSSQLRHVYRLGRTEGYASAEPSFVLVRVDVMEVVCGTRENPWSTVWEAPMWPKATAVR